jgi:hypothetical protein
MAPAFRRWLFVVLVAGLAVAPLGAQNAQENAGFAFAMGLDIGVAKFNETDPYTGEPSVTYESLGFTPDFSFGKFGIGLALTLNYRFVGDQVVIRQADWVPTSFVNFFEIYLPKIKYVRWGLKGEPLFIKAGSMDDISLGDGFLVANYANTLFLPSTPIIGLAFDMDGALFNFPYIGMETFAGDLAALDVFGGRLYVRPLVSTEIPILKDLSVGATVVADTRPNVRPDAYPQTTSYASPLLAFDADIQLPLFSSPLASIGAFSDFASLQVAPSPGGNPLGAMLGFGGKLIGFLTYGAQIRFLGNMFLPTYFGASYDMNKASQYAALTAVPVGDPWSFGWLGSLGTSFLDDKIVFNVSINGPFGPETGVNYPHFSTIFLIAEGILPGLSFTFVYDNRMTYANFWGDLVSLDNALIQGKLSYKTGPAVISFVYAVVKGPDGTPVTTSGLQSSIQLF